MKKRFEPVQVRPPYEMRPERLDCYGLKTLYDQVHSYYLAAPIGPSPYPYEGPEFTK